MFESPRFHPSLRQLAQFGASLHPSGESDVEIAGAFDGTFDGRAVTVLAGATVSGELTADTIEVSGIVRGRLWAKTVILRSGGVIEGEMTYDRLSVDAGARINALCHTG